MKNVQINDETILLIDKIVKHLQKEIGGCISRQQAIHMSCKEFIDKNKLSSEPILKTRPIIPAYDKQIPDWTMEPDGVWLHKDFPTIPLRQKEDSLWYVEVDGVTYGPGFSDCQECLDWGRTK